MIEFDSEQIILKPILLRPPSGQIMHSILLNWSSLAPLLWCFYLIAHPKGPTERDRIEFGANYDETYCSQTTPLRK